MSRNICCIHRLYREIRLSLLTKSLVELINYRIVDRPQKEKPSKINLKYRNTVSSKSEYLLKDCHSLLSTIISSSQGYYSGVIKC